MLEVFLNGRSRANLQEDDGKPLANKQPSQIEAFLGEAGSSIDRRANMCDTMATRVSIGSLKIVGKCFQDVCLNFCFGVIIFLVVVRYMVQELFTNRAAKYKYVLSG